MRERCKQGCGSKIKLRLSADTNDGILRTRTTATNQPLSPPTVLNTAAPTLFSLLLCSRSGNGVLWWACLSVCLSVRKHISATTQLNSTQPDVADVGVNTSKVRIYVYLVYQTLSLCIFFWSVYGTSQVGRKLIFNCLVRASKTYLTVL